MAQYRKAIVAVVTFIVSTLTVALEGHLIPEVAVPYVVGVITLAGAYGVYKTTNIPVETA